MRPVLFIALVISLVQVSSALATFHLFTRTKFTNGKLNSDGQCEYQTNSKIGDVPSDKLQCDQLMMDEYFKQQATLRTSWDNVRYANICNLESVDMHELYGALYIYQSGMWNQDKPWMGLTASCSTMQNTLTICTENAPGKVCPDYARVFDAWSCNCVT